ncbi:OmpA family protein [Gluconacetobacter entanii]|uniref:OmpA family protein n=1 Tax=Gluconacetobacter entanii TaxID=108528 RepID=A0A318PV15_9PROT|nr:OmpA family protein [Gluconacetobacter entanii]MBE7619972.1 OmpA family protein [Komagataeibacter sp. FXV2]MCE2580015.1 OmpA family protein [Komagataeibacter sp. FNDCR1]MBY4640268.1 OmpA family protein [Gluconacetobacter entanii]MCW4582215.1 OmpA family protein [Gluconacetobacter entanii]MCW4585426.1 OmpA family protein [Gluconacetobacter entanii]
MRRLSLLLGLGLLTGCAGGHPAKFVVFFTQNSTQLDTPAQTVISQAAQRALAGHGTVRVEGYAAASKDLSADELLAIDRAKIVGRQLVVDGVDASRIRQQPRGPVNNEDGALASRRVEIEVTRN